MIANGGSSNNRDSADNTNSGIKKFWKETGASSVMIARAAEWNPSVFSPDDKRATVMQVGGKEPTSKSGNTPSFGLHDWSKNGLSFMGKMF